MTPKRKVLILYASYGDGHLQAARALREQFEERGIRTVLADLFAEAHPVINTLCKRFYMKSYSSFPGLYGWLYDRTKRMKTDTVLARLFHSFGAERLKAILEREQPDLVINTFPMQAMAELKRQGVRIPTCTVVTDFTVHSRWLHKETDGFYVATRDLKADIVRIGTPSDRVHVSGIPLKQAFRSPMECSAVFRQFGLSPAKKTLLIMAGSYGVLCGMDDMCRAVFTMPGVQTVLVCGNNLSLYEDMKARFAGNPDVHVLGFVEDIHRLMSVSFCLVTKPGGVTLSEALCANLPVVLYRPVPGQERENAQYLARKGACLIAETGAELTAHVSLLLGDERKRDSVKRAMALLRAPRSAEAIVADIAAAFASGRWEAVRQKPEPAPPRDYGAYESLEQ